MLSQLSVAVYEGSLCNCLTGIAVELEFKSWLAQHANK
jgi:hypothetical protein